MMNVDAGRLFIHTARAVKGGEPSDRLFLVVKRWEEDPTYFVAWKVEKSRAGFKHPAFPKKVFKHTLELQRVGTLEKGKNGSTPTAVFKHDSMVQEVWA